VSVNHYLPHVFVLPEDDANSRLADGFHDEVEWTRYRQMQVLRVAGGRERVLELFKAQHVKGMDRFTKRFVVLLTDFDGDEDWLEHARAAIPEHLTDRVFILGSRTNPEALKIALGLGFCEPIGSALAKDCRDDSYTSWAHDLLRHNAVELDRLRDHVRPILFQS